jgi:putative SOS response-associated peptidase YedK
MCSQFELLSLSQTFHETFPELSFKKDFEIVQRSLPSMESAVLVVDQGCLKLVKMRFSLVPSWSKESKVKFATHNARIESVQEKPTWKKPFLSQHCAVPLTGFFESAYTGPLAGNIIQFKNESDELLFAAGVFDHWGNDPDPKNHFFSFSILTEEPTPFILSNGHDRTPIFLKRAHVKDWCSFHSNDFDETKKQLAEWSMKPPLKVLPERALKAGWEKRA